MMKMLSLHRPWAWCVVFGPKRCENRTWKPPANVIGQYIAIHAAKRWVEADAEIMTELGWRPPLEEHHPAGAIIGVCKLLGYAASVEEVVRRIGEHQRQWYMKDHYGWLLTDMHPLAQPVFYRGMQGLPNLPAGVEADVRGDLRAQGVPVPLVR